MTYGIGSFLIGFHLEILYAYNAYTILSERHLWELSEQLVMRALHSCDWWCYFSCWRDMWCSREELGLEKMVINIFKDLVLSSLPSTLSTENYYFCVTKIMNGATPRHTCCTTPANTRISEEFQACYPAIPSRELKPVQSPLLRCSKEEAPDVN